MTITNLDGSYFAMNTYGVNTTLIKENILSQEMLHFLHRSALGGVSMLFCSSSLTIAESILRSFLESTINLSLPGYLFCYTNDSFNLSLEDSDLPDVSLGHVRLRGNEISKLTSFQKLGSLVMYPIDTHNSYEFLIAILRGHVIGVIHSNDPLHALTTIRKGIALRLPQVTENEISDWICQHLPLLIEIKTDLKNSTHTNIIDLGKNATDMTEFQYIYRFNTNKNNFQKESDTYSFGDFLHTVPNLDNH